MERARLLASITAEHYEVGNQARCYKAVWRKYVWPAYKICYRTYLNYLGIEPQAEKKDEREMYLFDLNAI